VYAPRSRFLPDSILDNFTRVTRGRGVAGLVAEPSSVQVDVASRLRQMW
jgi:hypothetical protein